MKKSGIKYAVLGLILGLIVGALITVAKQRIAAALISLLNDEIQESVGGEFRADRIIVSLIPLRATAYNARLIINGESKLSFERIVAHCSINRIFNKIIDMNLLELSNGYSEGFRPSSATFKFIDHLTSPNPKLSQETDRFKLKLNRLTLRNSAFKDFISGHTVLAQGVDLDVERDSADDFRLEPRIAKLIVKTRKSGREIELGKVSSSIHIQDNHTDFNLLKLALGRSVLEINAKLERNGFNFYGNSKLSLDTQSPKLSSQITGVTQGPGKLSGDPDRLDSEMQLELGSNLEIALGGISAPKIVFDNASSKITTKIDQEGDLTVIASELKASGPTSSANEKEAIELKASELSGAISFAIESLAFRQNVLNNIEGFIRFSGPVDEPKILLQATAGNFQRGKLFIPELSIKIEDLLAPILNFSFSRKQKLALQNDLSLNGLYDPLSNQISKSWLELNQFDPATLIPDQNINSPFRFNASLSLDGSLETQKFDGSGFLELSLDSNAKQNQLFKGELNLVSGLLKSNLFGMDDAIQANINYDLSAENKSQLVISTKELDLQRLYPNLECSKLSATFDYSTLGDELLSGDGVLRLATASIGCSPYTLRIKDSVELPIKSGAILFNGTELAGLDSALKIDGKIQLSEGYSLKASGNLELASLMPFLPNVDELSGLISTSASIIGSYRAPAIAGKAQLSDGALFIEKINVSASGLSGQLSLSERGLDLDQLTGELNGGSISISGGFNPISPAQSDLKINFEQVTIESIEHTLIQISGQAELKPSATAPLLLNGAVLVEAADFQRNLDLRDLLKTFGRSLFASRQAFSDVSDKISRSNPILEQIELDLKISAPRNLFISTNFAAAELEADLALIGTVASPHLKGTVSTLEGWFGLKDRRFEISNASIIFNPALNEPGIDLIAESVLRSEVGGSTIVTLSANGAISNPKITLSSDQGLSEREILKALSSSSTYLTEASGTTFGLALEDELWNVGDSFADRFAGLIDRFARIDSITLEPSFNEQTGLSEPKLVTRKVLGESLSLTNESSFGSGTPESKLNLLYALSPSFKILASLDNVTQQRTSSFGLDLIIVALSRQKEFLDITFLGNQEYNHSTLLKASRLSITSRVKQSSVDSLERTLLKFYRDQGFFDAQIDVNCLEKLGYCRKLDFKILEGKRSLISYYTIEGADIAELLPKRFKMPDFKDLAASEPVRLQAERVLTQALRAEGYIAVKVRANYNNFSSADSTDQKTLLKIELDLGRPVTFNFIGNKTFTAEQLLASINLLERRQPFGRNTIKILVENIETLYRLNGYLYATISYQEISESDNNRIIYQISIEESEKIGVKSVLIEGLLTLSKENLIEQLKLLDPKAGAKLLKPRHAIAEELESSAKLIRTALLELGFPDSSVTYNIAPISDQAAVNIIYTINQGELYLIDELIFSGFPEQIQLDFDSSSNLAISQVNTILERCKAQLNNAGYLNASIDTELSTDPQSSRKVLKINAIAGELTTISDINISGNSLLSNQRILEFVAIRSGEAWDQNKLEQVRATLLRAGIFSRVEIIPSDGALDSIKEDLSIILAEKPRHTLEFGAGIDSADGFHLFGEASELGLLGSARTLSLRLDGYINANSSDLADSTRGDINRGVLSLKYSDPFIFIDNFTHSEELRYVKFNNTNLEFDYDRISLSSSVYRNFKGDLRFSLGHTILQDDLSSVEQDVVLSQLDSGTVDLSFINSALSFDQRNDLLNPNQGYTAALEAKLASESIGSDGNFGSVLGRASILHTPDSWERFTLADSLRVGASFEFADTEAIPITQRFYLGGVNSVRGFRENSLGPKSSEGRIIGGDFLIFHSSEFRYQINDSFSLHTFLDIGQVYLQDQSINLSDLRYSTGLGFRFISPIGPIGFDLGHPLDEQDGEPSLRVHFNIGSNY